MANYDEYQSPLSARYASPQMKALFSARTRVETWRKLWLWLAEAEQEVGLTQISDKALEAIRNNLNVTDASFKIAAEEEKVRRHDVMSHVFALEKEAPEAAGIIHLGATSCYVTDNADLLFMKDGLDMILPKLAKVMHNLSQFALQYKDLPALGFTHLQPAQPVTLGKRACGWIQDLTLDLESIEFVRRNLKFRGAQGTTGTQASYLELFQGDAVKVDQLNEILCKKADFPKCYDISTQTYSRKVDLFVANALAAFGSTAMNIATSIRLMAGDQIIDEPHETSQTGSSAMPYKSNPMRCERICSLGRKLSNLSINFSATYVSQWLERTLDDSAIRRADIPEMFLLVDAILITLDNVTNGLVVFPKMVEAQLQQQLPFMITEKIMMKLASHGVNRQEAHEQLQVLSKQAAINMRLNGQGNDLVDRIKANDFFKPIWHEIDDLLDGKLHVGRCPEIAARYAGPDGPPAQKLKPYEQHITTTKTAELAL